MPLHVLINTGPHQHWPVSNLDEEAVQRRFVEPWLRGEPIVAHGRHFNAGAYWLSVYDGPDQPSSPDPIKTSVALQFNATDVSDDFITEPFGARRPVPAAEAPTFAEDRRAVMVVHGRNGDARRAIFEFLRALDLRPLEWTELVGAVNAGAPYIGEVLDAAFGKAQAVVVLFSGDDVARLRPSLIPEDDPEGEAFPRGQARPNVFFEAGMALGRFPKRTILVELGTMRAASDLVGRHAVRLNQGAECRKDLAQRLERAGCEPNTDGTDWLSAGDFTAPDPAEAELTEEGEKPAGTAYVPALVRRIDALRGDLDGQRGYALWGIAQAYNVLLEESAAADIPKAMPQERTAIAGAKAARSSMTVQEIRAYLGQLRERLL